LHTEISIHVNTSNYFLGYERPLRLLFECFKQHSVPEYSQIGQTENYVQIVWNKDDHHLHINLYAISYDWFYRNRNTLVSYGVERIDPEILDPVLKVYFRNYF